MYDRDHYKALIGATVSAILISEETLVFQTDRGLVGYRVVGDCCSHSYFHDFYGVKHLLDNGPVVAFEEVALSPGDPGWHDPDCRSRWDDSAGGYVGDCGVRHEELKVYGYRLTTEHPMFGLVSSAFSFRNDSNGYYGGWMEPFEATRIGDDMRSLTEDLVG